MLERMSTLLCVIDLQDGLLPKIDDVDTVLNQSIKLIRFARALDIPIVWTEQYPKGLGRTTERVAAELEGLAPIEKVAFGCFGAPEFVEALEAVERDQILVVGIEAHVCVMQTALEALDRGVDVFYLAEAVGSRNPSHKEEAIARVRDAGAVVGSVEMFAFEAMRGSKHPAFRAVQKVIV